VAKTSRKEAGRCVFCGGTGLSKEHVISEWIGAYLPRQKSHSQSDINVSISLAQDLVLITP